MPRLLELFADTHSIGKAFASAGWEVVSLDMDPDSNSDIQCDFMLWDWTSYPRGYFDCVWASPPCTMYSIARTTAKTARDFEGSDALVARVLQCISYFMPKTWFMENPQTGYLKTRPVVEGLRYRDVSYCVFGYPYKKATRIWGTVEDWAPLPMCSRSNPCEASRETGRHPQTAQRGPGRVRGGLKANDRCSLSQLYSMPHALCEDICQEATRALESK